MKQVTHQCVAVATALAVDAPLVLVAGAWAGAALPDLIDRWISRFSFDPEAAFVRIHRGASHWFGWYVLLLLLLMLAPFVLPPVLRSPILFTQAILGGVAYGALSHVALDAVTPKGVPLYPFDHRRRCSLKLFATGSWQEYAFLLVVLCATAPYAIGRFPQLDHAVRQLVHHFL